MVTSAGVEPALSG